MGREVKRVALDFDWPVGKVWDGYLMPERLEEDPCPDCEESGYSPAARHLRDLWYGYIPFDPETNGSTPLGPDTPEVRAVAERHIAQSPGFYRTGEAAVVHEATRLATLWNSQWSHHLNDEDVAALLQADRLFDLTYTYDRETGWQKIDPPVVPTAAEVNAWSIRGIGHDSVNADVVITARCEREGVSATCPTCSGHGGVETYAGQRAEADAWEPTEPPAGEGWQVWETVSEGSPVSPVFATAEELAQWLTTPEGGDKIGPSGQPMTISQARTFVKAGWAPTLVMDAGGMHDGAEFVGTQGVLDQLTEDPADSSPNTSPRQNSDDPTNATRTADSGENDPST